MTEHFLGYFTGLFYIWSACCNLALNLWTVVEMAGAVAPLGSGILAIPVQLSLDGSVLYTSRRNPRASHSCIIGRPNCILRFWQLRALNLGDNGVGLAGLAMSVRTVKGAQGIFDAILGIDITDILHKHWVRCIIETSEDGRLTMRNLVPPWVILWGEEVVDLLLEGVAAGDIYITGASYWWVSCGSPSWQDLFFICYTNYIYCL